MVLQAAVDLGTGVQTSAAANNINNQNRSTTPECPDRAPSTTSYAGATGAAVPAVQLSAAQMVARAINQRRVLDGRRPIADLNDTGVVQHQFATVNSEDVREPAEDNMEEDNRHP